MINSIRAFAIRLLTEWKYRRMQFGKVGSGCQFKALTSTFSSAENIYIGDRVHIGPGAKIDGAGHVEIGDGSIFAPEVKIFSRTHNFDQDLQALPFDNIQLTAPVHIGRYVWLGSNVIVLPGVTIGEGAVIGAGAVVSRNIPPYAVAAGNPASVIRFRDKERFQELAADQQNFVYTKFGHKKLMKPKVSRPKN